jgi:uncharacterized protein YejL (UPF0352 family)
MEDKEIAEKMESASALKDAIGNILEEHNADLDVAIAVLMALATDAAIFQAGMEPEVVIAKFATSVCKLVEMSEAQEEREEVKWLN